MTKEKTVTEQNDILKQAVIDAEKVRSVAYENAKIALAEHFQPRLQSMISNKIKEEIGDEDEDQEDDITLPGDDEITDVEETGDENPESVDIHVGDEDDEEGTSEETEEPSNVDVEETEDETDIDITPDDKEIDITIEPEDETGEETEEGAPEDEDVDVDIEDEEPVDENITITEDELNLDQISEELDKETCDDGKEETVDEEIDLEIEDNEEPMDEDINLDIEDEEDGSMEENIQLKKELTESKIQLNKAFDVVEKLRGKINEVNLLNSKLLYSNKIFRSFSLDNNSKVKVIEGIDRAKTIREAKLIYLTLCESISNKANKKRIPTYVKTITENIASNKIASTKPGRKVIKENKIINENVDIDEQVLRYQKLAGIENIEDVKE